MNENLKQNFLLVNQSLVKDFTIMPQPFHPVISAVQIVEPIEDWNYRVHSHTYFELIIPLGKPYRCSLNQQNLSVPKGSFLLIQPGQIHQDFYVRNVSFRCIHFLLKSANSEDDYSNLFLPDLPPQKQIAKMSAFAKKSCNLLFEAFVSKVSDNVCNNFFSALFWMLLDSYPSQEFFQKQYSGPVQNILQYRITLFFHKALESGIFSLKSLQDTLQVSPRTLEHLSYKLFGNPPAKAFQAFRCQNVRKFLLEHPEASLKDTAELFHYNDQFSMSRSFRKEYGYPPSEVLKHFSKNKTK